MIWLLYIRFIVPVLGVFYGTSLIADEVDDKTITYLFVRPIPRGAVLIGKYLAYLVCTTLLVLPSVVLVYFLVVPIGGGSIGAAFPALVTDLGMLALGLVAYGALFAWVGARLKRPLVIGLVFAFGWEPAVLLFPGYLKRATIAYYLQALVPHAMPQDSAVSVLLQMFQEFPSAAGQPGSPGRHYTGRRLARRPGRGNAGICARAVKLLRPARKSGTRPKWYPYKTLRTPA